MHIAISHWQRSGLPIHKNTKTVLSQREQQKPRLQLAGDPIYSRDYIDYFEYVDYFEYEQSPRCYLAS